MDVLSTEARAISLDQEPANIVVFVLQLRPDDRDISDGAGGDPHLLAVENVFVSNLTSARPHASGIGPEVGLGQPKAAKLFATSECGKPSLFLFLGAELVNGIHH